MSRPIYKILGQSMTDRMPFKKADGTLCQTVIQQIKLPAIVGGEKVLVHGATTVSCLANAGAGYPGFFDNTFTAAMLYLTKTQQGPVFNPNSAIAISTANGEDIQSGQLGAPMDPYQDHDQSGLYQFATWQTGDWWAVFVGWASSESATINDSLWIIPQQTMLEAVFIT